MIAGTILLILRVLLTLTLYLFLGWVLLTLWRELTAQTAMLSTRRIPPLHLHTAQAQEAGSFQFLRSNITIGRNPACDGVLDDDTVSAYHAQLVFHHDQWWVEDLNSTNGTFLNDRRISSPIVLTSNDRLRFGKIDFNITIKD